MKEDAESLKILTTVGYSFGIQSGSKKRVNIKTDIMFNDVLTVSSGTYVLSVELCNATVSMENNIYI